VNKYEFADDFLKGFSQKLPDFFECYRQCWLINKVMNNSNTTLDGFVFWYIMQTYIQNQVKILAEELPEKGKKFMKEIDEKIGSMGNKQMT
jgi:phage-related holin